MQFAPTRTALKTTTVQENLNRCLWEHTGSNRGPSACKADALNQLSYAPFICPDAIGSANIHEHLILPKFRVQKNKTASRKPDSVQLLAQPGHHLSGMFIAKHL